MTNNAKFTIHEMYAIHRNACVGLMIQKGITQFTLKPGAYTKAEKYLLDMRPEKDGSITFLMKKIDDLGADLENFTDPNHPEYDPEFDAEIRKTRPDWFDATN